MAKRIAPKTRDADKIEQRLARKVQKRDIQLTRKSARTSKGMTLAFMSGER